MIELTCTLNGSQITNTNLGSDQEQLQSAVERAALMLKARYPEEVQKIGTLTETFAGFLIMQFFESTSDFFNTTKEEIRDKLLEVITRDMPDEDEEEEEEEENEQTTAEKPLDASEGTEVESTPIAP